MILDPSEDLTIEDYIRNFSKILAIKYQWRDSISIVKYGGKYSDITRLEKNWIKTLYPIMITDFNEAERKLIGL